MQFLKTALLKRIQELQFLDSRKKLDISIPITLLKVHRILKLNVSKNSLETDIKYLYFCYNYKREFVCLQSNDIIEIDIKNYFDDDTIIELIEGTTIQVLEYQSHYSKLNSKEKILTLTDFKIELF